MSPDSTRTPAAFSAASRSSGMTPTPGPSHRTPLTAATSSSTPRLTTPSRSTSTELTVAPSREVIALHERPL